MGIRTPNSVLELLTSKTGARTGDHHSSLPRPIRQAIFFKKYFLIWLCQVCFNCMWDLVPGPEIKPRARELRSAVNHCTTREVPDRPSLNSNTPNQKSQDVRVSRNFGPRLTTDCLSAQSLPPTPTPANSQQNLWALIPNAPFTAHPPTPEPASLDFWGGLIFCVASKQAACVQSGADPPRQVPLCVFCFHIYPE